MVTAMPGLTTRAPRAPLSATSFLIVASSAVLPVKASSASGLHSCAASATGAGAGSWEVLLPA